MTFLSKYSIYLLIYGYIFLTFLKGYYPANETGILFIGFLIFMSLSFKFGGSLIKSELDSQISSIYNKIHENLSLSLEKQLILRQMFVQIISLISLNTNLINNFVNSLKTELTNKIETTQKELVAFYVNQQLNLAATHYLKISDILANKAELLALNNLVKNPALN